MAGATRTIKRAWSNHSQTDAAVEDAFRAFFEEINNLVLDVETVRGGAGPAIFNYKVENLAAAADITERAFFQAPVALTVEDSVKALQEAASAGIDGSNTAVITLRNITEAVDVAVVTLTADVSANAATALTLTVANADIAALDILGIVVTQGTTADLASFVLQFAYRAQAADAAADLVAATLSTIESN